MTMTPEYRAWVFECLNEFKRMAEQNGMSVVAVAVKGSQNYGLTDFCSDLDANLVFAPSLRQLRENMAVKLTAPFGEVTCHNLYTFADVVSKGNPQWVEIVRTEFVVGDLSMFSHLELSPAAVMGMFKEKQHAMSHRYPSRAHVVDQYGYDPKQLHHLTRLYHVLKHNDPLHKYYGADREFMMRLKRNGAGMSLEEATEFANDMEKKMSALYNHLKATTKPFQKAEVDLDMLDAMTMEHLVKNYKTK